MKLKPIIAAIAVVTLLIFPAAAEVDCDKPPPDFTSDDLQQPMKFFMPTANVCLGNAVNNPYLAVGVITESTPAAFAEFAKTNQPYAPIEFTSTGGNLLAALKLGEMIREGRYDTSLGKICASACTYAIMGGVKRYIAEQELNADSD